MADIRLYTYKGYSILNKFPGKFHLSHSIEEAMRKIKFLRGRNNSLSPFQLVLVDYTESRSKIILVNNQEDVLD